MSLEEFISMIGEQETKLYRDCVDKIKDAYNKADQDVLKDRPWEFWRYADENICADYDVKNQFRKEVFGEKNYTNIEKDIKEHLEKLQKNIIKVVGTVNNIEKVDDTEYLIEGTKADCIINVTPAKLSSNKNIMKARVKVLDVKENEEELIEKEPSEFEESKYVKEWKVQELEGFKKALQRWKETLEELDKAEEDAKQNLKDLIKEYIEKNGKSPELQDGKYVDEKLHKAAQDKRAAESKYINYKNENRFFAEYGYSREFEEKAKQMIDKHFNELQAKVEKKIGRIIKIESLGGDDYAFEGEKGKCVVEVIWAGGYNIQRLHTRWIVKNYNLEEE